MLLSVMRLLYYFVFLLLCSTSVAVAQEYSREEIDLNEFVEELFALQDEDINYEDLYESLLLYYTDPLDLNRATRDELQSLYVLAPDQINNFFEHRARTGKLLSLYELQAIPGFDLQTIQKLLPFVKVRDSGLSGDNRPLFERIISEPNNYFLWRVTRVLQEQQGYTTAQPNTRGELPQRYVGSPYRVLGRFKVSHARDFSLGLTFEKDAGEAFTWDPSTKRYGPDFVSGHFMLENKGNFEKIVVGDYQNQFGQSLVTTAGFAVGKGAETVNTVRRNNLGLRPYTSVLEALFFRGAAATYKVGKNYHITGMYSNKAIDGRVQEIVPLDSLDADINVNNNNFDNDFIVSSLPITGFHRTPSEISTNKTIRRANRRRQCHL